MPITFNDKGFQTALFFETILGIISSSLAIYAIIFVARNSVIEYPWMFITSLTFWICYLIFSIFIIFLGIYTWYKEKHFDRYKKKILRAPIR
ncbi:MAG: hypothetical protein ACFFEY_02580 [Candidatus Thorarchaeota archaeon]